MTTRLFNRIKCGLKDLLGHFTPASDNHISGQVIDQHAAVITNDVVSLMANSAQYKQLILERDELAAFLCELTNADPDCCMCGQTMGSACSIGGCTSEFDYLIARKAGQVLNNVKLQAKVDALTELRGQFHRPQDKLIITKFINQVRKEHGNGQRSKVSPNN